LAAGSLCFWLRGLRLLGPGDARRQWLLAACVPVLMPSLYYDLARLGNDSLACLVFAATFYGLLRSLTHEQRRLGDFLWLGVALGCGLLTKLFFVPLLVGVIGLTAWFGIRHHKLPLSAMAARIALLVVIPLAISGWWFALCYFRYGMFFARQDAYAFGAMTVPAGGQLTAAGFAFQFCRAWAAFGAMFCWCGTWSMVHPPLWHYAWCAPIAGLLAWSLLRCSWRTMSQPQAQLLASAAVLLGLLLGAFGYLLCQRIKYLGIGSGFGGYYLFFAWPIVGVWAGLVFAGPVSTRWRWLLAVALAALLVFEASGLWYSCQVYAGVVAKLGDNKTGVGGLAPTPGNVALVLERLGAFGFPYAAAACYLLSVAARAGLICAVLSRVVHRAAAGEASPGARTRAWDRSSTGASRSAGTNVPAHQPL
jgi:hypothetical protein